MIHYTRVYQSIKILFLSVVLISICLLPLMMLSMKHKTLFFKLGIDLPYMFHVYKHKYDPYNNIYYNVYYGK